MSLIASKFVLSISLLLTTLIVLQFNGSESNRFSATILEMTNKLSNNLQFTVHCQDKKHDLGSHTVAVGEKWSFTFLANPFFKTTLYYCSFSWEGSGNDRMFNIYDEKRDADVGNYQPWEILESGPCRVLKEPECFGWDGQSNATRLL